MVDPDLARRYGVIVTVSADEVSALRRCDVYRVVAVAQDARLDGFPSWLVQQRPDLAAEVAEARSDLAWVDPADMAPVAGQGALAV